MVGLEKDKSIEKPGRFRRVTDSSSYHWAILYAALVTWLVILHADQSAFGRSDADIFTLIESLRQRAAQIQIDGQPTDWQGIPSFSDLPGDAGGDASRDIVSTAIAPRENDLLVLIATAGRPSQDNFAFWLEVDFLGRRTYEIQIGFAQQGPHALSIFDEGDLVVATTISGIEFAMGNVVEVRIPYATLAQVLPQAMAVLLTGSDARSFVRVRPHARDASGQQIIDFGAAAASYRLIPTPYPLDPPLPRPGTAPLAIELPFHGKWFLLQGAFSTGSHSNLWAYDLDIRDSSESRSNPPRSPNLTDNYVWSQPVFSPASATVIETYNDAPDGSPLEAPPPPPPPSNRVLLDLGGGVALLLGHFRQGSVSVAPGQALAAGDFLASVGDSGNSVGPHLHMHFQSLSNPAVTLPMAFANVRVSLNPGKNDPWARDFSTWEPRDNFFVERQPTGAAPADFDGDGRTDIAVYRDGWWYVLRSSDADVSATGWGGLPEDVPVPADYDGDGKTDITIYRAGAWYVLRSSDGGVTSTGWGGLTQDIPVPADYDGDGKTDIAVYRDGTWYVLRSSDGGVTTAYWGGLMQDKPVPADYDGDGKTDIAVYRDATWYVLRSSDGAVRATVWGGLIEDKPVPADYDGDGKADIAVYRAGAWYILRSSDDGVGSAAWGGLPQDIPVPADYDGDGKTDVAVYRAGWWHVVRSSDGGVTTTGWGGLTQDVPLN